MNRKIKSGFRVIGHDLNKLKMSVWHFPTLKSANDFAKRRSNDNGGRDVDVCLYLGSWGRSNLPAVIFFPAIPMTTEVKK